MKRRTFGRSGGVMPAVYILYFFLTAVTIMIAVLVYGRLIEVTDDRAVIAGVILAVIFALSAVLSVLDAIRRRYMISMPVKKITDATSRIAEGDFSVRLSPSLALENYNGYGEIMDNVNAMAAELGKTELLHGDFIANVSHEFKTPIAVIRNYAQAMADGALGEEEMREYARTVYAAADRLSVLVTNILRLNKMDSGGLTADFKDTDIGESLRQSVIAYADGIEEKGIELECDIADDVTVPSDESLLEPIWNNLLSNALKFTPEGGRISVTLVRDGEDAVVTVSDSGCGMDEETGRHIFDKFYQGDTSHAAEGNGLGLALVKKAIDLLGGSIEVESAPGKGSRFTVRL